MRNLRAVVSSPPKGSQPGPAARGCRSLALSARWAGCLKPSSPLLACACVGLKPPSPLRVRNGRFCCILPVQRCCRFQQSLVGGVQWCCWFQRRHVVAPRARKSSPCGAASSCMRENIRPARSDVCVSAKIFALHAQNTPKSAFFRLLGELFRGRATGGAVLGEFFRVNRLCGQVL